MSWTFLVTALVICVTPGTGAIYALAAGLSRGVRGGLLAALAGTFGTVPHLVAAITGLAAVLHASGVAFSVIKYLGVVYLLYMAWATWRDHGSLVVDESATPSSWVRVITDGITLNLLNPKLTIFFLAFLPQFVPAGTPGALWQMLALSGVFMVMTFVVFAIYGTAAALVRDRVLARPTIVRRMRQAFAASFVALSARLAIQQQ